jgi:hypothetical protein
MTTSRWVSPSQRSRKICSSSGSSNALGTLSALLTLFAQDLSVGIVGCGRLALSPGGSCKPPPESLRDEGTSKRLTQLRKKRNKRKKGASLEFLMTKCFGFTRIALWRFEVAPFSDLSDADIRAILSSPFPLLYRDWNGDDV